jgi:hypothetical protein
LPTPFQRRPRSQWSSRLAHRWVVLCTAFIRNRQAAAVRIPHIRAPVPTPFGHRSGGVVPRNFRALSSGPLAARMGTGYRSHLVVSQNSNDLRSRCVAVEAQRSAQTFPALNRACAVSVGGWRSDQPIAEPLAAGGCDAPCRNAPAHPRPTGSSTEWGPTWYRAPATRRPRRLRRAAAHRRRSAPSPGRVRQLRRRLPVDLTLTWRSQKT